MFGKAAEAERGEEEECRYLAPLRGGLCVALSVSGREDEDSAIEMRGAEEVVAQVEEVGDALGGWVEFQRWAAGLDAVEDLL